MTLLFGWCLDGKHAKCIHTFTRAGTDGTVVVTCPCVCHGAV